MPWCTQSLERLSLGSASLPAGAASSAASSSACSPHLSWPSASTALLIARHLLAYALDPKTLRRAALALVIIALVWVAIIIASHLSLRGRPTPGQRVVGGFLVGLLSFAVAAPMAVAARYSYVTASSVGAVFKSDDETKSATKPTLENTQTAPGQPKPQDPWAGKPRLNILLLGGDAGPGRVGTRTDTVILASINTKTGDTALISLPRNAARMPFPSRSPLRKYYPYGYTNGDGQNAEYFLNAMYRNVPRAVPKDVLGPTDNLGADVLKLSVGEATGLKVDYYVLINLEGFSKMINALGVSGSTSTLISRSAAIRIGTSRRRITSSQDRIRSSTDAVRCGMHAAATVRMTSLGWTGNGA